MKTSQVGLRCHVLCLVDLKYMVHHDVNSNVFCIGNKFYNEQGKYNKCPCWITGRWFLQFWVVQSMVVISQVAGLSGNNVPVNSLVYNHPMKLQFDGDPTFSDTHTHTKNLIFLHVYICIHIYICIMYIYIHMYIIHVHAGYAVKAKNMQAHSPKNGPASQRKPKERFRRCRDALAVLQQACEVELWLPQAMQRHVYSQRQRTGPWAQPPARHPQTSKLTYFRALQSSYTRKGSKTGFCEWQRWFLASRSMFACPYPHTSRRSSFKLAICIGFAPKLLRMCSKATVLHFVLAWPQSY